MISDPKTVPPKLSYRPEIDGMRAIAVVSVVLFHAGVPFFDGGFVGVDIFFVISGYLITSIIWFDIKSDKFSVTNFYERRARRILPAIIAVMACCLPFAWFFMLPDPLENFAQSVVATLFFGNNVLLSITSGYWDLSAEFKPLLHTWSLGVEEQFYFIIPVLLLVIGSWSSRKAAYVLLALAIPSLLLSHIWAHSQPTFNFYLLPTRAWELLAGSLCALLWPRGIKSGQNIISLIGLVLIMLSIFMFNDRTPFPSFWALAPVMGSAAIIVAATRDTLVGRFLAIPPMIGIGLISYSLYLWHQPVFAFARIMSLEELSWGLTAGLIVGCFLLSYLSWKFIEQPFRDRNAIPIRPFIIGLIASISGLLIFSGLVIAEKGYSSRLYPDASKADLAGSYISYNEGARRFTADRFAEGESPKVLVAGNSFARDFTNMAVEAGWTEQIDLIYRDDIQPCLNKATDGTITGGLVDDADIIIFASGNYKLECFKAATDELTVSGKQVLFVGPKHFGYNLNAFINVPMDTRPEQTTELMDVYQVRNKRFSDALADGQYVDLIAALSDDGVHIRVFDDEGYLISGDRVHLTKQGARYLGRRIFACPPLSTLSENALQIACHTEEDGG